MIFLIPRMHKKLCVQKSRLHQMLQREMLRMVSACIILHCSYQTDANSYITYPHA
jgi:hypothetical protein